MAEANLLLSGEYDRPLNMTIHAYINMTIHAYINMTIHAYINGKMIFIKQGILL